MSTFQRILRGPIIWILVGIIVILGAVEVGRRAAGPKQVPTSQIITMIASDQKLKSVTLIDGDQTIIVVDAKGDRYKSNWVGSQSQTIIQRLNERVGEKTLENWEGQNPKPGLLSQLLYTIGPVILMVILFFVLMNMVQGGAGGGRGVMGFGKSRAKVAAKDTPKTLFSDVAGCDEAIEELDEIREFLAEPAKFQRVGAKIPKGVLLYGPPGTGKTLLARGVAGEAGVPFFSISGSDFVEMFVGVGASRVRDLFDQAKEAAPAIIFIDEIDAVGRHRGAGMGGGHDEREQTLNQLLVEMDGFDVRGGVILIAATNRPDVLDPALLRPGRFDRQIAVEAPDMAGRTKILQVHSRGKPMAKDVDLTAIARRTPGYTGADLANVLNEAALLTARMNLPVIGNPQLDEAIDRVFAGPQKRTRLMNEKERLVTAYHEGGHALVAAAMPGTDPVQKITILPRGRALGYAMVMPDDDKYSQTRGELLDQMAYMLGGRAAEELIFHDPSTGASNDIEKATRVARAMVTQYGLSARIGTVQLGSGDSEPFLGMAAGSQRSIDYSDETARVVDEEVRSLLENAHQEAFDVLEQNRDILDTLVMELFARETLTRHEVDEIFADLKKWPGRGAFTGSEKRVPSSRPPVEPPEMKAKLAEAERLREKVPAGGVPLPPGNPGGVGHPGGGSGWEPPSDWAPPAWPGGGAGGPQPPGGPGAPGDPGRPGGPGAPDGPGSGGPIGGGPVQQGWGVVQPGQNGAGSNGAGSNGAGSNGAGSNGAGPNGAGPNGAGSNGAGPNGAGPNGAHWGVQQDPYQGAPDPHDPYRTRPHDSWGVQRPEDDDRPQ